MEPSAARFENSVIVLLLASTVALNACFCISAGPLWRDEANSVRQASLPSLQDLWESLQHDPFPVLYPIALRLWTAIPGLDSDLALRWLGLLTGLAVAASVYGVCRLLGSASPAVAIVLLLLNPLLVSESCSVRPYGASLVALLWAFGGLGAWLARRGSRWLAIASIAAVTSVQLSYANAIFVAGFCLSAAGLELWRTGGRRALLCLVPGALAALSLAPYAETLRLASEWTSLLRFRPDWGRLVPDLTVGGSIVNPALWALFAVLAIIAAAKPDTSRRTYPGTASRLLPYALCAAAACLLGQVLFVLWMQVPVFPRYFLPAFVFAGIALQLMLERRRRLYHAVAALAALALAAVPAWSRLAVRRTNVDLVAEVLSREATREDLVVLSPWFLHPSFQRYYRGPAPWITVPDLPWSPITRYDLIKRAIREESGSAGGSKRRLVALLGSAASVWFVHQAIGYIPQAEEAPAVPALSPGLSGDDYVHFRSYWERGIWHCLRALLARFEVRLPPSRRVWAEERLELTHWRPVNRTVRRTTQNIRK